MKNLADALFGSMPTLDLAESLSFDRLEIASNLLALEFERVIRTYARARHSKDDLNSIIDNVVQRISVELAALPDPEKPRVHSRPLDHREAEDMIRTTREVQDLSGAKRQS